MSTYKTPNAGTPYAWMIQDIQARDESLKAEIGSRNEEFLELTIHDLDQDDLFADEFEAPLGPPNGFEDGSSESLREDLNLFRRENDFERD